MDFTGEIAEHAVADYMLGYPKQILTPEGVPLSNVKQWRSGIYFQDDWKATQKLTLNLGVRYDLYALPVERNGVTRTLRFDVPGPLRLFPEIPGTFEQPYINEHTYIGPRFGLAYRLSDKTVIRGGYGIFRTAAQFDNMNILQLNPPSGGSVTVLNEIVDAAGNPITPRATIENPMPPEIFPANPMFNVVSVPPDRKRRNAYVQNANFMVQRQLSENDSLEAGWVFTKGTFVDTSMNYNQPEPGPGPVDPRRPYPQFSTIRLMVSDGNTLFHSLQTRYEHRFTRGLSLTTSYTWGHMIDDQAETINRGSCGCQTARNRGRAERANSVEDVRHRVVTGYTWELPWGSALSGASGALLKGWQFGGLLTFASGQPFTVNQSGDSQNKGGGVSRPHNFGVNPTLDNPDPFRWFDTTAFTRSTYEGGTNGVFVPGSGGYGTSPRNPLVGPGASTWDLSLSKSFAMPMEGHRILFRTEFFNAFNTPQFGNPGGVLGTGSFGRVTGTRGTNANRQIQFALKYTF
jgi:hypothetical protein